MAEVLVVDLDEVLEVYEVVDAALHFLESPCPMQFEIGLIHSVVLLGRKLVDLHH